MYLDPNKIRTESVKLRLSNEEKAEIDAVIEFYGGQKAVILREIVMTEIREFLDAHNIKPKKIA